MGSGQIIGLIHMFVCEEKKMSVQEGVGREEKDRNTEDFHEIHRQRSV